MRAKKLSEYSLARAQKMKQNGEKFKKILILLFIIPFGFNALYAAGGPEWLYWFARLGFGVEMIVVGIVFSFFLRFVLVVFFDLNVNERIPLIKSLYGIMFGLPFLVGGIDLLNILISRWRNECVDPWICIK